MARFLITYHGGKPPADPAAAQQMKAAFGKWLQETGPAVIDAGAPVRGAANVSNSGAAPSADIGGYRIVEAPSVSAAVALLKAHPFVARGGTLQVWEPLSI
jgi:hypothetical protein